MSSYNLIVAVDQNLGIGKNGDLPWHLPPDLKYFKDITTKTKNKKNKNVVVMGRITWESIPDKYRPLTDRINVVLTSNADYKLPPEVVRVANFDSIEDQIKIRYPDIIIENVFIIGGQQIFEMALQSKCCQRLYVTHIEQIFDCDVFLPEFKDDYRLVDKSDNKSFDSYKFSFCIYEKSSKSSKN